MFSNVSIGSFMGTSELASSLITLATNELSAGSASNAISLLPESENSSFSNAPLTPISAVKGILGNGALGYSLPSVLFSSYTTFIGLLSSIHLYCVRLLWVYCELRISLDELLENFQHVLYDYSEMSKISFVEPLHSFLRYPCIHQGYMVYVHCIYFHRIVMEEEGQLFQPHRLSQPEDPCYCCHV